MYLGSILLSAALVIIALVITNIKRYKKPYSSPRVSSRIKTKLDRIRKHRESTKPYGTMRYHNKEGD